MRALAEVLARADVVLFFLLLFRLGEHGFNNTRHRIHAFLMVYAPLILLLRDQHLIEFLNDRLKFCQKITYRTGAVPLRVKKKAADGSEYEEVTWKNSGVKAEDLLQHFRNSYNPRIAVTVDMIATGTDVRPLEIVFLYAYSAQPQLLRADEGTRHARHQS